MERSVLVRSQKEERGSFIAYSLLSCRTICRSHEHCLQLKCAGCCEHVGKVERENRTEIEKTERK